MAEYYDNSPAPAIERIARIEGQTTFTQMLILFGVDVAKDTTEVMAALSFARSKGCVPEALEAHVAQTSAFKLPLMSMTFSAIRDYMRIKPKDYPWVQGAVADAFLLVRSGVYKGPPKLSDIAKTRRKLYQEMRARCPKNYKVRARQFGVGNDPYLAMRNLAEGVLWNLVGTAQSAWYKSRGRVGGDNSYTTNTEWITRSEMSARGHHVAPKLTPSGPESMSGYEAKAPGMRDRLGWDDRNDIPGPVTTLQAQPPAPDDSSE